MFNFNDSVTMEQILSLQRTMPLGSLVGVSGLGLRASERVDALRVLCLIFCTQWRSTEAPQLH